LCSVIGSLLLNPTEADLKLVRNVLVESGIRGLHATGLSYIKNNKIITVIEPSSSEVFLEKHPSILTDAVNEDGNLYMVAHCRYSTSDLQYNQPMYNNKFSIVHNGVITQELPEKWKDLYGYDCKTKNDSELILHTLSADKSPLEEFPDSSIAAVELHLDKKIRFYRNGKRPIYFTQTEKGYIITSTADIAKRAGLVDSFPLNMNQYMSIDSSLTTRITSVNINKVDLQNV
jgi:glutamine phosphoribosylpyrophosphate amidotransferase